jgi:hypothetical protein
VLRAVARLVAITLLCAATPALAGAGNDPGSGLLRLAVGDLSTADRPNLLAMPLVQIADGRRLVMQLDGPMTPERAARLLAVGVRPRTYLPDNAWILEPGELNVQALWPLEFVRWVGHYGDDWKLSPEIGRRMYFTPQRLAIAARGEVVVEITLFAGAPVEPTLEALVAIDGARVTRVEQIGGEATVVAVLPRDALPRLARLPDVQFVEDAPDVTLRNSSTRWIVQSNVQDKTPLYENGIRGEGQVVGIMDGRVKESHCSFDDSVPPGEDHRKILAYNAPEGSDTHGTHVCGTAVGEAGVFDHTRGVAYMGRLVFSDIPGFSENSVYSRLTLHHEQGARVHSNSWGNDGTTSYDGLCRAIDRFSYDYEESLVLFAVTNQATLKNPENAKNVLAVGASQDAPNQHRHCSGGRGPTNDGRRKPEVYAPGCGTYSSYAATTCGVTSLTGTSMACPAVAGTAMLVRQYYTDGYYPSGEPLPSDGFTPSGALLKATLLNGSVDMTGISGYPSDTEGWGRVLIDEALYFPGDARRILVADVRNAEGLTTGQTAEHTFRVQNSAAKLKITLVFTDPPAAAGANPAYINNLDLEVVDPSGTAYLGNVFSNGLSVPGGSPDLRNNVEQVHLEDPASGAWSALVHATAVNVAPQGYALVITGGLEVGCPGDLNGDNRVDLDDLAILLSCYQSDNCGDLDGDGQTDLPDLAILLAHFGETCE